MNVQYEQQGNYLIPCVKTKKQEEIHLGVWANRHKQYLKQSHKVTEKLKAGNMMLWVRKMNNIRNRAREIVNEQVIYR